METEQARPIGASLLESTQCNSTPSQEAVGAVEQSLDEVKEREICYPPSLLSTAVAATTFDSAPNYNPRDDVQKKKKKKSNRILLQGPTGSGRSSLAMDFAMEIASKAPCLCHNKEYANNNCQCRPVAFLRSSSKADSFPLSCHRHSSQDTNRNSEESLQKLNHHQTCTNSSIESSSSSSWSKAALRRISVHHFANLPDCLHYLLSIAGKPPSEQPVGAIVVDDIECLVDNNGLGKGDATFQIMPLLAMLLDTARFVTGSNPSILVTMNSNLYFPVDSWMASFFNAKITLQEDVASHHSNNNNLDSFWGSEQQHPDEENNNLTVVSVWSAGVKLNNCGSNTQVGNKEVEYIVGQSNDEERIVWRMKTTTAPTS